MDKPIPFPVNRPEIPIVGQPFEMKVWYPTVQIVCKCEAKEPLLMAGVGAVAQCPACKRAFTVASIDYNAQTGKNHIGIAQVSVQEQRPS